MDFSSGSVFAVLFPLSIIAVALVMFLSKKTPEKEAAKQLAESAKQLAESARLLAAAEQRKQAIERVKEMSAAPGGYEGQRKLQMLYGKTNPALFCQHCQTKGHVRSMWGKSISKESSGIINTVLVGGNKTISRDVTKLHCDNCSMDWEVS